MDPSTNLLLPLIRVLPASSPGDPLRIEIQHFPFSPVSCPLYLALSYSHSHSNSHNHILHSTALVTSDGIETSLHLPHSLAHALTSLRFVNCTDWLYAHSFPTPASPEEQTLLLRRHGEIFASAGRVVAVLGLSSLDHEFLTPSPVTDFFAVLEGIGRLFWTGLGLDPEKVLSLGLSNPGMQIWGLTARSLGWLAEALRELDARGVMGEVRRLLRVLRRDGYWRSCWAAGELFSSSRGQQIQAQAAALGEDGSRGRRGRGGRRGGGGCYFLSHGTSISARLLAGALILLEAPFSESDIHNDQAAQVCATLLYPASTHPRLETEAPVHLLLHNILSPPTPETTFLASALRSNLSLRRSKHYADPRDAILSLLPFCSPAELDLLNQGNASTTSPAALFTHVTRVLVAEGHTDILAWGAAQDVSKRLHTLSGSALPSWVPDFTLPLKPGYGGLMVSRAGPLADPASASFRAAGGTLVAIVTQGIVARDPDTLSLMGCLVDGIVEVGDAWSASATSRRGSTGPEMANVNGASVNSDGFTTGGLPIGQGAEVPAVVNGGSGGGGGMWIGGFGFGALGTNKRKHSSRDDEEDGGYLSGHSTSYGSVSGLAPEPEAKMARSSTTTSASMSLSPNCINLKGLGPLIPLLPSVSVPEFDTSPLWRLIHALLAHHNATSVALHRFLTTIAAMVDESILHPPPPSLPIPPTTRSLALTHLAPAANQVRDPGSNLLVPLLGALPKAPFYYHALLSALAPSRPGSQPSTPFDAVLADPESPDTLGFHAYVEAILRWPARRPARTRRGYIGLVPLEARVGDAVVLLNGVVAPMVLRRAWGTPSRWTVVGEAWMGGMMDGEVLECPGAAGPVEAWHLV